MPDTTIEKFSIAAVYSALLDKIDKKEEEIVSTLNKMSNESGEGSESDTQLQMELQIEMNEWNVIYSTLSNVIKAVVEAMRTCYGNIK